MVKLLVHVQPQLTIGQFTQEGNHINGIYMTNPSVIKVYQLFDPQKSQTRGNLMNVVGGAKLWFCVQT